MRAASLAILGVAAYAAFAVATLPARWALARFAPAPGFVQPRAVEGTIWSGEAQALVQLPAAALSFERIEWSFLPARLVQGRLAYAVVLKGAGFEATGEIGRSLSGWSVRGLAARADAALATAAVPLASAWRPEGTISVDAASLAAGEGGLRGALAARWTGAATALSDVRPLGTYRLAAEADGPGATFTLSTPEGALRLAGKGRIDWPSRIAFTGEARAAGPKAAALAPLLDRLGPARADGSRALEWRAR